MSELPGGYDNGYNNFARGAEKAVLDGVYVAVGLGLIWFQRAQVRRRELAKSARSSEVGRRVSQQVGDKRTELARVVRGFDQRVGPLRTDLATRVDQVEQNLPVGPRVVLRTARVVAQSPETLVRSLLGVDD